MSCLCADYVAARLSLPWDKSFGKVFGWTKVQLSFAVIRATDLCIRGSRACEIRYRY